MHPAEKVKLARQIERLGADVIEAGFPIASAGEVDAVKAVAEEVRGAKVAALARAKDADIKAAGKALAGAARPVIHTFLATSAIHLKYKLKITQDEALRQAVNGVKLARSLAPEVEFSAEDASRTEYALPARGLAGGPRGRRLRPERARHRRLLAAPASTPTWWRSSCATSRAP